MSDDADINEQRTLELREAASRYTELIDRIVTENREQGIAVAIMTAGIAAHDVMEYVRSRGIVQDEEIHTKTLEYVCGQARFIADLGPKCTMAFLFRLSLEVSNNFREARVYYQIEESMRNIPEGEK